MIRMGFKMKLNAGKEEEYKNRHARIWPELKILLKDSGVYDYSIFLDKETLILFGTLKLKYDNSYASLPENPVMIKWWNYMKDIMETNSDHSPASIPLDEVFYLE
jgi:L-rhamnose mutarotase